MTIRTKGDMDALLAARTRGEQVTGGLFSVEGLHNLEGDFGNVAVLFDAGMRMAGFTHFFDNEVAGSMHGVKKGPLTDLGRKVFAELERRGTIVDIAHASHPAIAEMLERATKPVVSSHGGVQATCDVNRNLTDEEIRGVAATRGVVGIGYWDAAICELTPTAVVDAIEHVIEVGGIGPRRCGSTTTAPPRSHGTPARSRSSPRSCARGGTPTPTSTQSWAATRCASCERSCRGSWATGNRSHCAA